MKREYNILEIYFRILTILFWSILLYNWIFIPNTTIDTYIFFSYLILSTVYLILFTIMEFKNSNIDRINYFYKFISTVIFAVSILYFLLFSNNINLFIIKSLVNLLYFYISCKKVFKSKDEEGVVGIIGSLLIFILATYY